MTQTLFTTPYIALKQQGNWTYASRTKGTGAVGIIAVTEDRKVLLVEQFRIPHNKYAIELPAGLLGDEKTNETPIEAANKELLEETGYIAEYLEPFGGPICSSAGLSDETIQLFLARKLKKVGNGGGVNNEDIIVHEVDIETYYKWVLAQQAEGKVVDSKVLALPAILQYMEESLANTRKTTLQFKVCPEYLRNNTIVEDPVRVIITKPDSIFITGILGESGRRMISDGAPFIFTRKLAEELIMHGVATAC